MGVFGSRPDIGKLEAGRDVEGLIRALQYQDDEIRIRAARALADFCPEDACPALIACLSDDNERVRDASVSALVATGEPAIPLLFNAMGDRSWLVRRGAALALKKLRWTPDDDEIRVCFLFAQGSWEELAGFKKKAIPYLIEGLRDENPQVRQGAARALGIIGDTDGFEPLTRTLADPDTGVRGPAALALGELKDPRAIPFLLNLFYDNTAGIRNAAADALAVIGMPAFEPLVSALNDPKTGARLAAIRSLSRIRDPRVIQPLIGKLEDSFPEIRTSAAVALGELGAPALPPILAVMKRGSRIARLACLDAFAKNLDETVTAELVAASRGVDEQIARKAESVLRKREGLKVWQTSIEEEFESPTSGSAAEIWNIRQERKAFEQIGSQETDKVLSILGDNNQMARLRALLRRINEDRPVVEALIMILKNKDDEIRRRAVEAIDRLEGISGNPFLIALHDNDPFIRTVAARTLGRLGWMDAIKPLIHHACEDKDTYVRGTAGEAVTTMGMKPDLKMPVTDQLITALSDESAAIRAQSAELLGNIGSAVAIPALISLFRDRDETVHARAAEALAGIGRQAFPALAQAVHDPDPRMRCGALTALAEYGGKGEALLKEGLKDTNPDVRAHARKTLATLRHESGPGVAAKASITVPGTYAAVPAQPAAGVMTRAGPEAAPADPGRYIPYLADRNERVRQKAIESLAALGEAAFRPLVFAAYNPDKALRSGALEALAAFGTMGAPYILKGLEDDEIDVQHTAYRLLNRLDGKYGLPKTGGPALKVGTPPKGNPDDTAEPQMVPESPRQAPEKLYPADIIPRLADSSGHVRERAIEVLVSMGEPAFLPLVYAAYHPDKTMRIGALRAIARFGAQGSPYILRGLEDDELAVRDAVYQILREQDGRYGLPRVGGPALTVGTPVPVNETPVPADAALSGTMSGAQDPVELAGLLDHASKEVQMNAAMTLAMMGTAAMPALINSFASRNLETRATAAEIISSLGPATVVYLMKALTDPRSDVVAGAASVLGKLGDKRAVPALIALLEKNENGSGLIAAEALGYLGDSASVSALIKVLNGTDSELQSRAARALGYIGDERAVSSLIEALGSEDFSVRRIAIDALIGIGEPCIPYLSEALLHSDRGVRSGAAECFQEMGFVPRTEQEQIQLLVANEEWLELTKRGKSAVDVLIYFVDDANEEVRGGALTALGKVGGSRAIETLAGKLADSDPLTRRKAMGLLAGMGTTVLPVLRNCRLTTTDPVQQQALDQVLERVGKAGHAGTAR